MYGNWMAGMTTRHYANDLLSVLDSNPPPAPSPRRLVYGRGYGASVADEMQTILNCNSRSSRASCPWWQDSFSNAVSSCGTSYFIPSSAGFQLDAFVFDGAHDFEKTDAKQLYQAGHALPSVYFCNILSGCQLGRPHRASKLPQLRLPPTFRQGRVSDALPSLHSRNTFPRYKAVLDAFSLMNQGWCPRAIEAG